MGVTWGGRLLLFDKICKNIFKTVNGLKIQHKSKNKNCITKQLLFGLL